MSINYGPWTEQGNELIRWIPQPMIPPLPYYGNYSHSYFGPNYGNLVPYYGNSRHTYTPAYGLEYVWIDLNNYIPPYILDHYGYAYPSGAFRSIIKSGTQFDDTLSCTLSNSINIVVDWVNLPKELVTKVAEHLELYEDFETLQLVCSPWRLAAKDAHFRAFINNNTSTIGIGKHTLPLLMIPPLQLISFSKNMIRHINLPDSLIDQQLKGQGYIKRLLSSYGWLFTKGGVGDKLWIFNPFSGVIIEPPEIRPSWIDRSGEIYYEKFVLSANPSTTSDFVAFLVLGRDHLNTRLTPSMLLYWRNGGSSWIPVTDNVGIGDYYFLNDDNFLRCYCRDITYYQGEFYGVNFKGKVVKFQTNQFKFGNHTVTQLESIGYRWLYLYYLVESVGQLLVIRQVMWVNTNHHWCRRCTVKFEVLELNVDTGKVTEVTSLGNRAVFVGSNSSFSVEVSPAHNYFKPNCIYKCDDYVTCRQSGCRDEAEDGCIYNLTDGKFEKLYDFAKCNTLHQWVETPNSS
ncbi:F-box protein SKIP23-like [Spinacia oleracea]|uniref:F-box protein SKIP23-like n=1 Tax=Spinacia oleracea TaxID=3562 RepID=A0ABM3QZX9_SPIOL|nr:F-box protein SKIP23-like [Spinacia oleracea]